MTGVGGFVLQKGWSVGDPFDLAMIEEGVAKWEARFGLTPPPRPAGFAEQVEWYRARLRAIRKADREGRKKKGGRGKPGPG